jgi:cobalt-zinc-cadmium efflux system protein
VSEGQPPNNRFDGRDPGRGKDRDRHRRQDHGHSHVSARSGARYKGRLAIALGLLAVFMVVELVAGILTGSLALVADAGHMLTDVVGIGMALAAIHLADKAEQRRHRTFGLYRQEILAALANSLLLFGVALYVLIEAARRLREPAEVLGTPMLIVAVLGLLANLVAFALLREGSRENLNLQGAYLEVLADTIASVGVIVAAVTLQITGWTWVDAVAGLAIGLFIVPRTWRLGRQALRILIQAAPPDTDIDRLHEDLASIEGVVDVHDVHVWTLTSDMDVASAHVMVHDDTDSHRVLDQARDLLRDRYGISHATLQVEPASHQGCDEVSW